MSCRYVSTLLVHFPARDAPPFDKTIYTGNVRVVSAFSKGIRLSNHLWRYSWVSGLESSTNIGDAILINTFRQFNTDTANALIVYSLYDETWDLAKNTGEYEEGYPMSWALSDYQLNRMKMALDRANRRNLRKFRFMPKGENQAAAGPLLSNE